MRVSFDIVCKTFYQSQATATFEEISVWYLHPYHSQEQCELLGFGLEQL